MALQLDPNGHLWHARGVRHARSWQSFRCAGLLAGVTGAWLSGCTFDPSTSGNPAARAGPTEVRPAPRVSRRGSAPQPSAAGATGSGAATAGTSGAQAGADAGSPAGAGGAQPGSAGAGAPAPPPAASGSGGVAAPGSGTAAAAGAAGAANPGGAAAGAGSAQPPAAGEAAGPGAAGAGAPAGAGKGQARGMEPDDRSEDRTLLAALIELVSSLTRRPEWGDALVDVLERLARARRLNPPLVRQVLTSLDAAGACEAPETACTTACELMRERCGRCERDKRCQETWDVVCDADADADSARCN